MYSDIINILESSAADDSVRAVVMTGSGDYYCSGNDLSNFKIPPEGLEKMASENANLLRYIW